MKGALPAPLRAYSVAADAATPLSPLLLTLRQAKGKEDASRLGERRGLATLPRPGGRLVWIHGASVGETVTILPLAERLSQQGLRILITSGTVTSAKVAADRLPDGALHQFIPLDLPRFVRRFLDHWRPDAAIFAESELWPTTLVEAERRNIPIALVNARMSPRSFGRWQLVPRSIGALLGRISLCLAQSDADGERFSALGAPRVLVVGNLKFDAPPPPADASALATLRERIAGRPVLVAASTHPGEEQIVAAAHAMLKDRFAGMLTVIVPRHPERGEQITRELAASGNVVARRAAGAVPTPQTSIYIADTIGELGLFYRLGPVVLVGGSLVPRGGQNPIEAIKLGNAVLHGPHVDNFRAVYSGLDAAGGARPVGDAATIASTLGRLLDDPDAAAAMARAGAATIVPLTGALDRTVDALRPLLALPTEERG